MIVANQAGAPSSWYLVWTRSGSMAADAARRRAEGTSAPEIHRFLKRAVAGQVFKLLERCDPAGLEVLGAA